MGAPAGRVRRRRSWSRGRTSTRSPVSTSRSSRSARRATRCQRAGPRGPSRTRSASATCDLEPLLRGADIVHAAELSTWFAAQAARLKGASGFKLALTVWETIPSRGDLPLAARARVPAGGPGQRRPLPAGHRQSPADAAAGRDRPGPDRAVPAGHRPGALRAGPGAGALGRPELLSAGRLVWEKGHQDVLRALAAVRGGLAGPAVHDVGLSIVGDGPRRASCAPTRTNSGWPTRSSSGPTVPLRRDAGALRRRHGAGAREPAHARVGGAVRHGPGRGPRRRHAGHRAATGAIPEVLDGEGRLVAAGDWLELRGCSRRARWPADAASPCRPTVAPGSATSSMPPRGATGTCTRSARLGRP